VDAIPLAPLASDASVAVHPDAAADALLPALAVVVPCAEKLAVPAPAVQAPAARLHPARALPAQTEAPYIPGAGRSAA
jgi:hypothetical protein